MKQIEVYTLSELKEANPEAFERVHERWAAGIQEIAWSDETMDSLKAVVDACGGTMHNWRIGAHSPCSMSVSVEDTFFVLSDEVDDYGDPMEVEAQKDAGWLYDNVLKAHGYPRSAIPPCAVTFPGILPFTGYCADDNFLESVYKALESGDTLTEALEGLADVAGRMMEDDLEQQQDEESMMANWGECRYTIDGIEV